MSTDSAAEAGEEEQRWQVVWEWQARNRLEGADTRNPKRFLFLKKKHFNLIFNQFLKLIFKIAFLLDRCKGRRWIRFGTTRRLWRRATTPPRSSLSSGIGNYSPFLIQIKFSIQLIQSMVVGRDQLTTGGSNDRLGSCYLPLEYLVQYREPTEITHHITTPGSSQNIFKFQY